VYADVHGGPVELARSMETRLAFRTSWVRSISKQHFHRIAYTEWGNPNSEQVAVCVHGLSRQGRDFDFLADTLASRGYRVVCPDLAGRGKSGWLAQADDYALPQYSMDMTVLLARLGVDQVDWVGTSLGGMIGMILASLPDSPIRRLVINDIGPFVPRAALVRIGEYLRTAPVDFPELETVERYLREILSPFGELTQEQWKHITAHSVVATPEGRYRLRYDRRIAEVFRLGRVYDVDLWSYWDAVTCPVLVLRGETSDLLLPETAAEMAQRGPRAEVVEIGRCGHCPALMDDAQIELVTSWLVSPLARLTPSSATR
jgi:pimeloyl-ACP methyl ester carboxylesterase